jgi:putative hemolysin
MYVYASDDYAGLETGDLSFYYGYEETHCNDHGGDMVACEDNDCDEAEWCFTVRGDGGNILMKKTSSELDPTREYEYDMNKMLILGMGEFINELTNNSSNV